MSSSVPRLAPPGAGLPWYQHLVLRYYMGPFVAKRSNLAANARAFEVIHGKMLALAQSVPLDRHETPVLVPPMPALEDSSRYWSIAMTLEHVLTVGEGVKNVIRLLASGRRPELQLSVARVKPKGGREAAEILEQFVRYTSDSMAEMEMVLANGFDPRLTQEHPWFGQFNALQWHWLLGTHGGIHYRQLKAIAAAAHDKREAGTFL